jgi:hypothetical protein
MMKKLLLVLLFLMLIPSVSLAEKGKIGTGPNPYTDCGIGATFDNKAGASSSNAIWDLGSTAITSAASSPEMCKDRKAESAKLILETLPELEKDVALGKGKYLLALTEVMGCDSAFQGEINTNLRTIYAEKVSDVEYGNKTDKQRATDMYNSVKVTIELIPNSCKAIL